ncbi:LapA family protein [Natronospira bacteriovora]|uniref:LapA family protein n=1 Tax=Natronospira bacteriovora TaxID=3069753 RepID=A0ABU0W9L4_9GAMM|nr:LapA family protein [Natronospira sp. AB-CW4]MDQ2070732.1 LapA family protein [Natronospira sp. AB-CW4]
MTGAQKGKAVIAAVLVALVIVFVIQNRETVGVEFLIWTWTASRAVVLFTVFLVGVLAGWLARGAAIKRKRSGL